MGWGIFRWTGLAKIFRPEFLQRHFGRAGEYSVGQELGRYIYILISITLSLLMQDRYFKTPCQLDFEFVNNKSTQLGAYGIGVVLSR